MTELMTSAAAIAFLGTRLYARQEPKGVAALGAWVGGMLADSRLVHVGWTACELCHLRFRRARAESEAMAESRALFGAVPDEQLGVVCDECFADVMLWLNRGMTRGGDS
jgi:hypothetical protein